MIFGQPIAGVLLVLAAVYIVIDVAVVTWRERRGSCR